MSFDWDAPFHRSLAAYQKEVDDYEAESRDIERIFTSYDTEKDFSWLCGVWNDDQIEAVTEWIYGEPDFEIPDEDFDCTIEEIRAKIKEDAHQRKFDDWLWDDACYEHNKLVDQYHRDYGY